MSVVEDGLIPAAGERDDGLVRRALTGETRSRWRPRCLPRGPGEPQGGGPHGWGGPGKKWLSPVKIPLRDPGAPKILLLLHSEHDQEPYLFDLFDVDDERDTAVAQY